MRREFHVRFYEGPGVQFPRATRRVIALALAAMGVGPEDVVFEVQFI